MEARVITGPTVAAERSPVTNDPTRMRDQPALRTSTGTEWLVIGLVLAGISVAVLLFQDHATSDVVAAVVVALYVAMLVVRVTVRPR